MSDGVTESYLAALEECRAAYRVALNELRERNEDLREWGPKVEALAKAAEELCAAVETGGGTFPFELAYRLRVALTHYRGEKP